MSDIMRKANRELTPNEVAQINAVKDAAESLWELFDSLGASRELSIAKTKIEEAAMWGTKAITSGAVMSRISVDFILNGSITRTSKQTLSYEEIAALAGYEGRSPTIVYQDQWTHGSTLYRGAKNILVTSSLKIDCVPTGNA